MALSNKQVLTIVSACVLYGRCADVLSDFEQQLVRDIAQRYRDLKNEAQVTDEEWVVIDRSIDAMRAVVDARVQPQFELEPV